MKLSARVLKMYSEHRQNPNIQYLTTPFNPYVVWVLINGNNSVSSWFIVFLALLCSSSMGKTIPNHADNYVANEGFFF